MNFKSYLTVATKINYCLPPLPISVEVILLSCVDNIVDSNIVKLMKDSESPEKSQSLKYLGIKIYHCYIATGKPLNVLQNAHIQYKSQSHYTKLTFKLIYKFRPNCACHTSKCVA